MKGERSYIVFLCTLCFVTLSLTLTGCRPRGILSSREMRKVLAELHKTDAVLQVSGVRITDYETRDLYYAQALEKHGVTQAQFDSSLVWYTAHPQFFNKIYPKVLKDLAAEEEAYRTLHAEELDGPGNGIPMIDDESRNPHSSFSRRDLDSVLWVMQNGHGNSWRPLVHDLEDQLFPQIGVFGGGVVDTLQAGVDIPEISHD